MNKLHHNERRQRCLRINTQQSGFSLIEIMVAALVLSIGILGVASLQIIGLKGTQQSYMKQQAMSVIQNLTERMRSNKEGVFAGNYVVPDSNLFDCTQSSLPDCSSASSDCSSVQIATADIHNLVCGYKTSTSSRTGGIRNISATDISTFSGGKLSVTCPSGSCLAGDLNIQVNWIERGLDKSQAAVSEDSLIINTRIAP